MKTNRNRIEGACFFKRIKRKQIDSAGVRGSRVDGRDGCFYPFLEDG